jgi:protein-tyrosine phosphatase
MRTQAERAKQPNQLPPGTEYVVLDILKDSSQAGAAQLLTVLGDPKAAEAMLGGGKAVALFEESYRELVSLPSALAGYLQFFSAIAGDAHTPAVFHCTTGKDRTGWAAASTLLLGGSNIAAQNGQTYDSWVTGYDTGLRPDRAGRGHGCLERAPARRC